MNDEEGHEGVRIFLFLATLSLIPYWVFRFLKYGS